MNTCRYCTINHDNNHPNYHDYGRPVREDRDDTRIHRKIAVRACWLCYGRI